MLKATLAFVRCRRRYDAFASFFDPGWGVASQPAHFHHGLFTTLRESILAHAGEALDERTAFQHLTAADQNAIVGFLKSLQFLPPGTRALVVDEHYRPRPWPVRAADAIRAAERAR
ncbi:MAG: hypothetical protein JF610_09415 [Acidobacteria bacterium]|nr:hypothetical protein [Acidobacteriota bacterium]